LKAVYGAEVPISSNYANAELQQKFAKLFFSSLSAIADILHADVCRTSAEPCRMPECPCRGV